ncbi:unnamed protein product, partial [Oikopleura dioica]
MPPSKLIDGKFRVEKILEHRANSTIVLVKDDLGKGFIMKQIGITTEEKRKEAEEEANILKSLDHMSIVKFVTTSKFDFGMGEYFGLVMENCEGGNLARYLGELVESKKKATDNEILRWVTQLVMALGYCHEKNIIHRDVKPANVFMMPDKMKIKLGDFDISKAEDETEIFTAQKGTLAYISPEILENKPLTTKADIWGLGCIVFEMKNGKHPFLVKNNQFATMTNIMKCDVQKNKGLIGNIIAMCLKADPNFRADAARDLEKIPAINSLSEQMFYVEPKDVEFGLNENATIRRINRWMKQEMARMRNQQNEKLSRQISQSEIDLKKEIEQRNIMMNDLKKNSQKHKFIIYCKNSNCAVFPLKIDPDFLTPSDLDIESLFKEIQPNNESIRLFFEITDDSKIFESSQVYQSQVNIPCVTQRQRIVAKVPHVRYESVPVLKITINNITIDFELNIGSDIVQQIQYEVYLIDNCNRQTNHLRINTSNASLSNGKATFSARSSYNIIQNYKFHKVVLKMTKV